MATKEKTIEERIDWAIEEAKRLGMEKELEEANALKIERRNWERNWEIWRRNIWNINNRLEKLEETLRNEAAKRNEEKNASKTKEAVMAKRAEEEAKAKKIKEEAEAKETLALLPVLKNEKARAERIAQDLQKQVNVLKIETKEKDDTISQQNKELVELKKKLF